MTEKEKIHSGNIYFPNGDEILREQLSYLDVMDEYNRTSRLQMEKRRQLLRQVFAEVVQFLQKKNSVVRLRKVLLLSSKQTATTSSCSTLAHT